MGQDREEVMSLFGDCAERRVFIPPGPGTLYVEVYQAKNDEACIKRLGERHFLIRGGVLHYITPGRMRRASVHAAARRRLSTLAVRPPPPSPPVGAGAAAPFVQVKLRRRAR